ncbi:MAG TPA: CHAD domain-containing protein [Puia sp.]
MSGIKIHNTIRKQGENLSGLAAQITLRFDADSVHDFRTTTKKLRALSKWLSPVKKPLTKSFTGLYHITGELRNAQVLLTDLETAREDPSERKDLAGFRSWLTAFITRQKEEWYKAYDRPVIRRLRKKIKRSGYKKGNEEGLKRFCRKRVNHISGILYIPSPSDEELHNARKMLQDMQYVYEFSGKKGLVDDAPTLETLKRIGKQAGAFNDKRMAVLLLTRYLEEERPEDSCYQAAMEIKGKWDKSRERQKKELIDTLTGFIKGSKW